MKKIYERPELFVKEYATFENVFAGCNNVSKANLCMWSSTIPNQGQGHSAHTSMQGS